MMTMPSKPLLAAALLLAAVPGPVAAAEVLGESAALSAAVSVLKGDPYGDTPAEVAANIAERRLTSRRDTVCGGGSGKVWAFHVVVSKPSTHPEGSIDGWLVLDARRGEVVCATLPFLD